MTQTQKPPIRLFSKQKVAWDYLHDNNTTEIAYGGWAGWWKSLLWSLWLATQIANKPGSTWCIWRSELKKIKLSTLITFKKVLKDVGFSDDSYKYDDQKSIMTFTNGCLVVLMDLNENPSDPNYDRLWSTEYTGAFIDEAQEVSSKAKNILTSRLRNLTGETFFYSQSKEDAEIWMEENKRWILHYNDQLKEYEVVMWRQEKPKLLMTLNPGRNFIYTDFYKPWKSDSLQKHRQFIQSLPTDNPFLPPAYIDSLKNLDKVSRERLLYGNFEYSDDDALLFSIDDISAVFRDEEEEWDYYITVDAARQWRDHSVIILWRGLRIIKVISIKKSSLDELKDVINNLSQKYHIQKSNIIVDEVWVGGWLVDMLGCRGFIANAAPIQPFSAKYLSYRKRNYANLKTQAFFYLQKYLPQVSAYKSCEFKEQIIEEALFIRQTDIDNDNKIKLESKKDTKEKLWRSPDYIDAISFRMWWIIKAHHDKRDASDEDIQEKKDELWEYIVNFDNNKNREEEFDVY